MPETTQPRRYRCNGCGNLTRFDVIETTRTRRFYHFALGLDVEFKIDEEEVLSNKIEDVICRWCGRGKDVRVITETEAPTQ